MDEIMQQQDSFLEIPQPRFDAFNALKPEILETDKMFQKHPLYR
jgi:hypothetical protein